MLPDSRSRDGYVYFYWKAYCPYIYSGRRFDDLQLVDPWIILDMDPSRSWAARTEPFGYSVVSLHARMMMLIWCCGKATVLINGAAKEIGMAVVLAVTKARGMEVAGAVDSYLVGEDIGKVTIYLFMETSPNNKTGFLNPEVITPDTHMDTDIDVGIYLTKALKGYEFFVAPYLQNGHHVVLIVCPNHGRGFILDSFKWEKKRTKEDYYLVKQVERVVGRLCWELPIVNLQEDIWECGFYVMKWVLDFVLKYQHDDFPNIISPLVLPILITNSDIEGVLGLLFITIAIFLSDRGLLLYGILHLLCPVPWGDERSLYLSELDAVVTAWIILDMDPSRSWAPRWLNKEQVECGTIREDLPVQTRINVVHVRDISENGQCEIGKDHCFTSFAFEHVNRTKLQLNISLDRKIWNWTLIEILIKKNNCSAGGRIEPVETPSAQEKGCVNALEEFIHLISERESKNFRVRRHDNDHVVTLHQFVRPRFKILASFMMPIAWKNQKQEASDKAFEEVRLKSLESDIVDKKSLSLSGKRVVTGKPTKRSRKPSGPILGSTVQIVSRTFTDFTGTIKKPDKKKRSGNIGAHMENDI
ncbi:ulp1 protease family, C-terminal catalytic domain-containing protein [Tanacetum coccineum]